MSRLYRKTLSERELKEARSCKRLEFLAGLLKQSEDEVVKLLTREEPAIGLTAMRRIAVMKSLQALSKRAWEQHLKQGDLDWLASVWQHTTISCFVQMRAGTYARDVKPVIVAAQQDGKRPSSSKTKRSAIATKSRAFFKFPATFTRDVESHGLVEALRKSGHARTAAQYAKSAA